ncbi:hypothetical protein [Ideonella oryzae]|uniref:Uncharacterized protein n=1 Tax=Ideonella oryzae TaxID=2937441 RepID=A0ABT1BHB4_9BURK|nr:hypothetical protein [Ideonella oryzae]MCO5975617.1 hypothetical protein [Ideonella oryzae]
MKNYWGAVVTQEDMSLHDVAAELNRFLFPVKLEETDRFDEVPGFVADRSGRERFVLQGVPLDLPADAPASERYNYFYFRCSEPEIETLPPSLRNLPRDAEVGRNGYSIISEYLCQRLCENTRLRCEPDL